MKLELDQTLELGETPFLEIWCLWDSILDVLVPHGCHVGYSLGLNFGFVWLNV